MLTESVPAWSDHEIEPYGFDFTPRLVDLARARLPQWADRNWGGDAAAWAPPFRFDFVDVRVEIGQLERVRGSAGA